MVIKVPGYLYFIEEIARGMILLFLDLINSVLKSLFEEMYRVIGDQPTCSSNL